MYKINIDRQNINLFLSEQLKKKKKVFTLQEVR
uniref:Uncharacterized protein n=1 Tax=Anguilla anguilla TaxID=7936 RepID=A0A0E9UM35_ANGAN